MFALCRLNGKAGGILRAGLRTGAHGKGQQHQHDCQAPQ
jgi:hypothetical protein